MTQYRDWFEFAIPNFSGKSLVSATLSLDDLGHLGGPLTFALYGLSGQPLAFTDVTTSNPFGSISTTDASNNTTITISLNSPALAAIAAAQGGNLFIGGIDSGENVPNPATVSPSADLVGDFGSSGNGNPLPFSTYNSVLNLTTAAAPAAVPEPASVFLLGAVVAIGLMARRRANGSA